MLACRNVMADSMCEIRKAIGYCEMEDLKTWMEDHCNKACGYCESVDTGI